MKHKSEITSSFHFLLGHLKCASIFERFIFENLMSKQFEVLTNGREMSIQHWQSVVSRITLNIFY